MKVCYRHRGAISVFLTLILLPTVVFGGLVTDAVRIYHSRSLVSEAGELAMNAGLSHYDMKLKDDYGLFVMDISKNDMTKTLEQYFVNSIRASGLEGAENAASMLDLKCDDFKACGVIGSEIYQTEVEKQQILEYMKYRAPVCLGEELLGKLKQIKESKQQAEAMKAQVEYAENMDELQDCCEKAYDKLKKYVNEAEENTPITVMSVNGAINAAEASLKEGAKHYLLMDVIDQYKEKGSSAKEGETIGFMEDFVTQAETLSSCTEGNAKDFMEICLACLYDRKTVEEMGLPNFLELDNNQRVIYNNYMTKQTLVSDYRKKLEIRAKSCVQDAWNAISSWYVKIYQAEDYAKEAKKQLDKLMEKLKDVRKSHDNWEGKVNALSDSEMKQSMQESLKQDSYNELLKEDKVEAFYQKIETNIANLDQMKNCLKDLKFCGLGMTAGAPSFLTIQQKVQQYAFFPSSNEKIMAETDAQAEHFISVEFVKTEIPTGCELFTLKSDEIYKEMAEICKEKEESEDSKDKKKKTDQLLSDSDMDESEGISGLTDADWNSVTLPSDVLSQAQEDSAENAVMKDGSTDKGGRKKAMTNAKNSISATADLLGSLSEILEKGIENICIMEYGMQMFSYYTVDKDDGGKEINDVRSISNRNLKDDALYKSEVEYMLWGKKNAQENVKNTKLLLYGIRALFNFVYAFSDSTVGATARSLATIMSCGHVYLVPVFEVILKVALAGAETVMDVTELMNGKSVVLFKKYSNAWISLETFGKRVVNGSDSSVKMNYREYMTAFLLINTFGSKETKTLARIADCIQLNTGIDITEKCYTMVSVNAKVQSRTTFMSKAANLPGSGLGAASNDWHTIPYQSVLGY